MACRTFMWRLFVGWAKGGHRLSILATVSGPTPEHVGASRGLTAWALAHVVAAFATLCRHPCDRLDLDEGARPREGCDRDRGACGRRRGVDETVADFAENREMGYVEE